MSTIHETYGPGSPVAFEGTRAELTGGEYLGSTAQPDLFKAGDIVTGTWGPDGGGYYYYDPELRIDGNSVVRSPGVGGTWYWRTVERAGGFLDAPAPTTPPQPCLDRSEPAGTMFPCSHCASTGHLLEDGRCVFSAEYREAV